MQKLQLAKAKLGPFVSPLRAFKTDLLLFTKDKGTLEMKVMHFN